MREAASGPNDWPEAGQIITYCLALAKTQGRREMGRDGGGGAFEGLFETSKFVETPQQTSTARD